MDYRCFFCFAKAFEKLLVKENISLEEKSQFTCDMAALYQNSHDKVTPPEFSRELHILLEKFTGNSDPYNEAKQEGNRKVMSMFPGLKKSVQLSINSFDTALRLAIAGNIIDFAANGDYNLQATIEKVLNSDFAINHSEKLKAGIENAGTILYLGDNAGEIVFDKLFIEDMQHKKVCYAVRGGPVINDATVEDAQFVGMENVAKVISNGYNAPSTILEHCSEEFKKVFQDADLIISKGQGNLEGLINCSDKNIFYLLMVKCEVIAELLHVKKGDFVVKSNQA